MGSKRLKAIAVGGKRTGIQVAILERQGSAAHGRRRKRSALMMPLSPWEDEKGFPQHRPELSLPPCTDSGLNGRRESGQRIDAQLFKEGERSTSRGADPS